jgi:hypothetical protein
MVSFQKIAFVALICGYIGPGIAQSEELKKTTVQAWEKYIQAAEAQFQASLSKGNFQLDGISQRKRELRKGDILVNPTTGNGVIDVEDGLIHDWTGAIFIPDATIQDVFEIAHNFNEYQEYYKPGVVESKLLRHSGDQYVFFLRLMKQVLWVTAVMDGDFEAHYFELSPTRWYSYSFSTRLQEVVNYGKPDEHRLPPGEGSGYLWRVFSVTTFEESSNGVYIQMRAIGLTRSIPFLLSWLVTPIANRLSRNSLLDSLESSRKFILKRVNRPAHVSD